jgi:anaerobic selenocysteine-containing dehydrogenase
MNIKEREWTIIETTRGKIKQRARFSTRIGPGMVDVQHSWWFQTRFRTTRSYTGPLN